MILNIILNTISSEATKNITQLKKKEITVIFENFFPIISFKFPP